MDNNNENGQFGNSNTNQEGFAVPPTQPTFNEQQGNMGTDQAQFTAPPVQPMGNEQPMFNGQPMNNFSGEVKPPKKKGGLIVAIIAVLIAAIGGIGVLVLKDPLLKVINPKAYLQSIYDKTVDANEKLAVSGDLISADASFQIDEFKVMGISQLDSFNRIGFDLTTKVDKKAAIAEGVFEMQLGAREKLALNYAVDEKEIVYLQIPQLLNTIISVDMDEMTQLLEENNMSLDDYVDSSLDIEEIDAKEAFKRLLRHGTVSKGEKEVLGIDEKVKVEYMLLTVSAENAKNLFVSENLPVEYIGKELVIGFGIYKNRIVSVTMSDLTFVENISGMGIEASVNDIKLESVNDKLYAFAEIEIEGIGVNFEMNGTTKAEKNTYTTNYDISMAASGLFSIKFSGDYTETKLNEFIYDMDINKAESLNDIINSEMMLLELAEEIFSNYQYLNIFPAEISDILDYYLEDGFLYDDGYDDVFIETEKTTEKETNAETEKTTAVTTPSNINLGVVAETVDTEFGITYQIIPLESELVFFLKNNNTSGAFSGNFEIIYYDDDGKILDTSWESFKMLGAGREAAITLRGPKDTNYANMAYASYDITFKQSLSDDRFYDDMYEKIEISHNISGDKLYAQFKNNGDKEIGELDGRAVFYKGDKVVGTTWFYLYDIEPEKTATDYTYLPYDSDYNNIDYDTYVLYFNSAVTRKED
jgi:hypothetical protein